VTAAKSGFGPDSNPDFVKSCTCCRNVLIREPRLVRTPRAEPYMLWMCPSCDVSDEEPGDTTR
jgi:hypothetical protein